MRKLFLTILFLLLPCLVYAKMDGQTQGLSTQLTPKQFERVKVCKDLLQEVDAKSLDDMVSDVEQTSSPEENLQILEAVAQTYSEIVKEQKVEEKENKEWLHSMISLNMAYLQLGGGEGGGDTPLNRMIRRKLKEHLSSLTMHDSALFHSLE